MSTDGAMRGEEGDKTNFIKLTVVGQDYNDTLLKTVHFRILFSKNIGNL